MSLTHERQERWGCVPLAKKMNGTNNEDRKDSPMEQEEGIGMTDMVDLDKLGTSLNSMRDLIFVDDDDDDDDDPMNGCWSSMTGSDDPESDGKTDSLASDGSFHHHDAGEENECLFLPTSLPYAQLAYDPHLKTLIALLEVSLAVHGGNEEDDDRGTPTRLRMLERQSHGGKQEMGDGSDGSATNNNKSITSEDDKISIAPFAIFEDLPAKVVTRKPTSKSLRRDPNVFSTELRTDAWLEDALELYLLHDCQDREDDSDKSSTSCTEALRKLLLASRSMVVFRSRMGETATHGDWHKVSRGQIIGVGYSCLLEI